MSFRIKLSAVETAVEHQDLDEDYESLFATELKTRAANPDWCAILVIFEDVITWKVSLETYLIRLCFC
jgi:hypothetical protein